MEQAAFEPNDLVPGIGLSPDRMLLAAVHRYSKDGAMRTVNAKDPVYAPNSYGAPKADSSATD